jgi:two-component system phosphate regulon response regulator PhoB
MRRVRPSLVEGHHDRSARSRIDRTSHRVRRANRDIHLGPTEYRCSTS